MKSTIEHSKSAGTIGQRFLELRHFMGFNQKEFAKMLGISQTHVSAIETGRDKPSRTLRLLVAHLFKLRYEWLETGEGEKYTADLTEKVMVLGELVDARDALWGMVERLDELLYEQFWIKRYRQ